MILHGVEYIPVTILAPDVERYMNGKPCLVKQNAYAIIGPDIRRVNLTKEQMTFPDRLPEPRVVSYHFIIRSREGRYLHSELFSVDQPDQSPAIGTGPLPAAIKKRNTHVLPNPRWNSLDHRAG